MKSVVHQEMREWVALRGEPESFFFSFLSCLIKNRSKSCRNLEWNGWLHKISSLMFCVGVIAAREKEEEEETAKSPLTESQPMEMSHIYSGSLQYGKVP